MGYWNCRVMRKDGQLAVHEVFYDDQGNIKGYTETPVFMSGENLEELRQALSHFNRAVSEPILDYHALEAEAAKTKQE